MGRSSREEQRAQLRSLRRLAKKPVRHRITTTKRTKRGRDGAMHATYLDRCSCGWRSAAWLDQPQVAWREHRRADAVEPEAQEQAA